MSPPLSFLFRTGFFTLLAPVAVLIPVLPLGATPVQVTTQGSQPAPSRDGAWIAFRWGVYIAKVRPDGSDMTPLVVGIDPNWNRPGDLIVFGDYSLRLITVNATTAETTHVWTGSDATTGRCDHPVWSPVADEIVVLAPALTLVQYPHGPAAPVACSCIGENAAWSPDGQWISFDTGDIYKVPRTGGTPELVASSPQSEGFPSWSPDGRFIAYAEEELVFPPPDVFYPWHIWVADARGESFGKAQITEGPYRDTNPAWSPDGTTIYFGSDRGSGGIWKVPFDSAVSVKRATWGSLKIRYR